MKLGLFLSCVLLLCGSALLLADANDNAIQFKIDPMPAGWTASPMEGTFMGSDEEANMVQLNWMTGQDDFKKWCGHIKDREDGAAGGWTDYKSEDLKPSTAGPAGAMQFDRTGKRGDDAMHGRVYLFPMGKVFCWLKCSSTAATWEKNKAVFDEMVKNVK